MAIAHTLQEFLNARGVDYDVLRHAKTPSASRTAQESHISGDLIAKGVVVKDDAGFVLVVLPASHHINFSAPRDQLHRKVELASEEETGALFGDCDLRAVPAAGSAHGVDAIVDDKLNGLEDVCIEGGDHSSLLHVTGKQFAKMMLTARHGHFSRHD